MVWFWYFLIYSFLGFLVEVVYVRVVGGAKRDRKCRLLLPICPVYGLGALAVLALPPFVQARPLLLLPAAGAACTAVEYLTSLFYEKVFRVSFWDYSHLPGNLGGRVCPLFALFWGILALAVLYLIHPAAAWLAARIPLWALPPPQCCWGRTLFSPPGCCGASATPPCCGGTPSSHAAGPPERRLRPGAGR